MAKVTPIRGRQARRAMQRFFELLSQRERDRYMTTERYGRGAEPRDYYRNGYYERDFVTRPGGQAVTRFTKLL